MATKGRIGFFNLVGRLICLAVPNGLKGFRKRRNLESRGLIANRGLKLSLLIASVPRAHVDADGLGGTNGPVANVLTMLNRVLSNSFLDVEN